jgi:hypothetical protein
MEACGQPSNYIMGDFVIPHGDFVGEDYAREIMSVDRNIPLPTVNCTNYPNDAHQEMSATFNRTDLRAKYAYNYKILQTVFISMRQ